MRKQVDIGASPIGIPFYFLLPFFFDPSFNLIHYMKDYNRREFLKSGLLASTAFFFSFSPIERLIASNGKNTDGNIDDVQPDIRQLQNKAKEYFYRKEYVKAEQSYRQLIFIHPAYIAAYDGLAKTLYAQNKSLSAAEAYRQGWLEHKENHMFCDRLARAMKRLVAGNRKQEKEFCFRIGQSELLEAAALLYIDAIEKTKVKPRAYLAMGLLDVQRTLAKCNKSRKFTRTSPLSFSISVQNKITLITQTQHDRWEATRKKRKKREYNVNSELQVQLHETKNQKKNRRNLIFDDEKQSRVREQTKGKKQLYYPLFVEALKNKSTGDIEKFHGKIISIDSSDKNANGQLVHYYRKQKEYTKLVQFQKEQYAKKPDFWTTISYAQALRLKAKKQSQPGLCSKALDLYKELATKTNLKGREHICVYGGQLDCLLQQNRFTELRSLTLNALTPYPLSYMPFVLVYIKSWVREGKTDFAEEAYNLILNGTEPMNINSDPINMYLRKSHKMLTQHTGKAKEVAGFGVNKEQLFDLYYAMADLYKKKNNSLAERDILNRITQIEPDNIFVKKRLI